MPEICAALLKALEKLGDDACHHTKSGMKFYPQTIVILPGVGSFGDAMATAFTSTGSIDVIRKAVRIAISRFSVSASVCSCSSHPVRKLPGVEGLGICSRKNSAYPGYRKD